MSTDNPEEPEKTDTPPRPFRLLRAVDVTGVSGTGHVADGVRWPDGTVTIRWRGERPSTVHWNSLTDAVAIHGHGGHTLIEWAESETRDCPHCPDGHTPPTGGSQPWGAFVGPERDGDGQPTTIHVMRSAGAHVAESDAEWVWHVLGEAAGYPLHKEGVDREH